MERLKTVAVEKRFCANCMADFETEGFACPQCGGQLAQVDEASLIGQTLDSRYEIVATVGKGGMGVVYRARHKYLKRDVALKVLRRDVAHDSAAVKRFLQEAQVISTLTSPNTVTVHDFGVTPDGRTYFVMELMEGQSLGDFLESGGELSVEEALDIVLQTCDSLGEAHSRNIYHRDIKPDNLFMIPLPDGGRRIKVLDFGIARLGDSAEKLTATGLICGTPQYLSPEQAQGKEADGRADLYSLGIVLYESLAGIPPFHDETPVKTVFAHVTKPVPPLDEASGGRHFTEAVKLLVSWPLEKFPADRPQSAAVLAAATNVVIEMPADEALASLRKTIGWVDPATAAIVEEPTLDHVAEADVDEATADVGGDEEPTIPADFSPPGSRGWKHRAIVALILLAMVGAGLGVTRPWESQDSPAPAQDRGDVAVAHDISTALQTADVVRPAAPDLVDSPDVIAIPDSGRVDSVIVDVAGEVGAVAVDSCEQVSDVDVAVDLLPRADVAVEAGEVAQPPADVSSPDVPDQKEKKEHEARERRKERERRKREKERKEKERKEKERKEKEKRDKENNSGGTSGDPDGEYENIPDL